MTWKHWAVVLTVVGIGIVLQIPGHDEGMLERDPPPAVLPPGAEAETEGPYRTVVLEVTGMT